MLELLIIEDEIDFIRQYETEIKYHNENSDNNVKIKSTIARTPKEAENLLAKNWDAAIVDLRLIDNDNGNSGRNITELIKSHYRFPIFIVTALPHEASYSHPFVSVRTKEGENLKLLKDIVEMYNNIAGIGLKAILGGHGQIESYLNKVFWENIAHSVSYWKQQAEISAPAASKALLRYVLSHIQEHLELAEQGDLDNYHSVEFYINPPIKSNPDTVFTGDILKELKTSIYYIVITPTCDLVQRYDKASGKPIGRNAEYVTLVEIKDLRAFEMKKQKSLPELPTNNQLYHYIPKFEAYENGGVICFAQVKSVPLTEIIKTEEYKTVCAISSAFKKDIISRFSHYYARQGQPSLKS